MPTKIQSTYIVKYYWAVACSAHSSQAPGHQQVKSNHVIVPIIILWMILKLIKHSKNRCYYGIAWAYTLYTTSHCVFDIFILT